MQKCNISDDLAYLKLYGWKFIILMLLKKEQRTTQMCNIRRPELYALIKASSTNKIYLEICPCWGPVRPKWFMKTSILYVVSTSVCPYSKFRLFWQNLFQK